MTKKDFILSLIAGALLGGLMMPILKISKPELFDKFGIFVLMACIVIIPLGLWLAFLIGKKIAIIWQIAKFGVIGVLNTLVDWGALALLISFGVNSLKTTPDKSIFSIFGLAISFYLIYKAISFVVAAINSYFWNKYWTFSTSVNKKTKAEFLQFLIVSIFGFVINLVVSGYIFGSIVPLAGMNLSQWGLIAAACGSILGLVWNFVGYKFFVFRNA